MGPKTKELVQILEQIITLLKDDGETHWLKWMTTSKKRLLNSDYSGIEHLLGAYGGMGSFNDLVIGQAMINGEFQWKPGSKDDNERLDSLRSKAYELADFIQQNHDIERA